jgi:1-phosphatidylinositol-3-phosphate 5-kinase
LSDNEGEAEDEDEDEEAARKARSSLNRVGARRPGLSTNVSENNTKENGDKTDAKEPDREVSSESAGTSPERDRGPLAAAAAIISPLTSIGMDGTHESAAAELTVSSLLSGTLPASWKASLLPEGDTQDNRGSLLKTIASLWGRGNAHLPLIELPMSSTEHLFTDSPLVVLREEEPSSLIAFTLHSSTYASRLNSLREAQIKPAASNIDSGVTEEKKVDPSLDKRARLESDLRQQEGTHLSFQFSSGDCRFSIRVLFTEQFDALRQACECGQTFIQSLARCNNWVECSGGKSGVTMMKTLDDRFIIKQLSRAEMDAFASNAGAYFRFLADVLVQDRPTTLAKIYGVYRLNVRNAHTGKQIKLDCAITENVFANAGKMSQIYDLKGALRNRFVQPNGQATQVLQDGNLVTSKVPIYLRESAKRRLREALYHDSLFLANCEVMDYSLVVGVTEGEAEIRVGIIDFVR